MASLRRRELELAVEARLRALRSLAVPIAQAALAAGLAWYVAHDLIGHPKAFFAPIAALIALGVAAVNRMRRVVELTLGVALGIGIGDLLIHGIGTGAWQVAFVVLLAMTAAVLLGGGPLFVTQAATSSVLVATLVGANNASRLVDALVGGAIGLAVLIVVPVNPVRRAREAARAAFAELAGSLEDVASALEARDVAAVRQALNRARAAEATVKEWQGVLEMGTETARLSPPYWRARTQLERELEASVHIERAVRNTRVLARASIRAVELDPDLPSELPEPVRALAQAAREVDTALQGRETSRGIEAALRATALATRALERDPDLPAAHLVGQIRSTATDLLRALGVEYAVAVERVRHAAQASS